MLSWQAVRRSLAVVLFFTLLGLITLSPLSFHLRSQVTGGIDYYHFNWNYWWIGHALETGQNPYYTDMVLAPFRHNLAYHTLCPAWYPVYALLKPIIGQLGATNMMLLISIILSGALLTLFLRRQHISMPLALLGGVIFAFSPYMRSHIIDMHLNLVPIFWLPLGLLLWDQIVQTNRVGWAVLIGVALWGMWMTDVTMLILIALLLGPYGLLTLVQAKDRQARLRLIGLGMLALAITVALAWFVGPLQPLLKFNLDSVAQASYRMVRHYSLSTKVWDLTHKRVEPQGFGMPFTLLVVLALVVPSKDRLRWLWFGIAVLGIILALGPDIKLAKNIYFPMPFRLLYKLSGGQYRVPNRFTAVPLLALIVFLCKTFDPWLRRVRKAPLRGAVAAGLMFVFLADFYTLRPMTMKPPVPPYHFYEMMGHENYPNYDYVVLEVPLSPQTGVHVTGDYPQVMYYGITHHKRMVAGLLSRIPERDYALYLTSPLLTWLEGIRPLRADQASEELTRFVNEWPIGYVVVHQDWLTPEQAQEVVTFMDRQPSLCRVETERDAVLYRAINHPAGCPAQGK